MLTEYYPLFASQTILASRIIPLMWWYAPSTLYYDICCTLYSTHLAKLHFNSQCVNKQWKQSRVVRINVEVFLWNLIIFLLVLDSHFLQHMKCSKYDFMSMQGSNITKSQFLYGIWFSIKKQKEKTNCLCFYHPSTGSDEQQIANSKRNETEWKKNKIYWNKAKGEKTQTTFAWSTGPIWHETMKRSQKMVLSVLLLSQWTNQKEKQPKTKNRFKDPDEFYSKAEKVIILYSIMCICYALCVMHMVMLTIITISGIEYYTLYNVYIIHIYLWISSHIGKYVQMFMALGTANWD